MKPGEVQQLLQTVFLSQPNAMGLTANEAARVAAWLADHRGLPPGVELVVPGELVEVTTVSDDEPQHIRSNPCRHEVVNGKWIRGRIVEWHCAKCYLSFMPRG